MKNENLIRAIGALDEDLIERAEMRNADTIDSQNHNRRYVQRPRRLVACIVAALIIIGGTAAFAATGLLDSFLHYFSGNTDAYIDEILSTITSASNEDLEISIDGAVFDNHQFLVVFTTKAITDRGKRIVNKQQNPLGELTVTATLRDGSIVNVDAWGYTYYEQSSVLPSQEVSYVVRAWPVQIEIGLINTLTLDFDGLSLGLNAQQYMDVRLLCSDDVNSVENAEISPIGFYLEVPPDSIDRNLIEGSYNIYPILADGTIEEDFKGISITCATFPESGATYVCGDYGFKIIDFNKYSGLQINGVNYYITEN